MADADGGGDGGGEGGGGEGAEGRADQVDSGDKGAERGEAEAVADDPNFAVVCSFLHTFGLLVQVEQIAVPKLARLLLNTQEVPAQLSELFAKLLRKAIRNFRPNAWEKCLIKFCHQCGHRQEAWEIERFGYKKSSVHVKIRILKCLLEYQFVCNNKFKTAVNKLENRTLRLNPVGRDEKGRCYWMHRDHRANIRLYREDQDEETWKLIASDRAGVVDIITALKSGKSPTNSAPEPILNEDSNSLGSPSDPTVNSETDNASKNGSSSPPCDKKSIDTGQDSDAPLPNTNSDKMDVDNDLSVEDPAINKSDSNATEDQLKSDGEGMQSTETLSKPSNTEGAELSLDNQINDISKTESSETVDVSNVPKAESNNDSDKCVDSNCDDKTIEEKVMIFKGEGNGAECEAAPFYFSDEIVEEVMYITGEGSGYDCMTGNPAVETTSSHSENQSNDANNCEFQNSKEEEVDKSKAENESDTIDHNVDAIHEKVNCNENISKTSCSETSDSSLAQIDSKSNKETSEDADQDSDSKSNQSAPLPVTKRFLQNIPKSDVTAEVSDTGKSKLWSVDSMCGNVTSESPINVTEKNSISESNETVLLNKNSLNNSDSKNDTENTANIPTSDTIENIDSISIESDNFSTLNTNSDKITSVDTKILEKPEKVNEISTPEKVNEISTPKKFFFGQPGCLKLSPDISTLSPNNLTSVKDTIVNNIEVKSITQDKETPRCEIKFADKTENTNDTSVDTKNIEIDEKCVVIPPQEEKITDLPPREEKLIVLPPQEEKITVLPPREEKLIVLPPQEEKITVPPPWEEKHMVLPPQEEDVSENATEDADSSSQPVKSEYENVPESDVLISNVNSETFCEIPVVPEKSSIDSSKISENLTKNETSNDIEMSVHSDENKTVLQSIPSPIQHGKHKADSVDSTPDETNIETESSAIKKIKLSTDDINQHEKHKADSVDSTPDKTISETKSSIKKIKLSTDDINQHGKHKVDSVDSTPDEKIAETESFAIKKIKLSTDDINTANNTNIESAVIDNQNCEPVENIEKKPAETVPNKLDSANEVSEINKLEIVVDKKTEVFIDETNNKIEPINEKDVHKSNGTSKDKTKISERMDEETAVSEKIETHSDSDADADADVCNDPIEDEVCVSEKEEVNTKSNAVNRTTRSASLKKNESVNDDSLKKDDEPKEKNHTETTAEEQQSVKKGKSANTRKRVREASGSMLSDEEDVKSNKKSKLKQKKTNIAQRKKVEEQKLEENLSSDEDAEESPAKASKKVKGKTKNPQKTETKKEVVKKKRGAKSNTVNEDLILPKEDDPPIRQSRRIAQLKIKEEAQRRLMEEVALRELKEKHKKKNSKGKIDQDWKHSSEEHSSDNEIRLKGKGKNKKDKNWQKTPLKWNSSSGGNDTDTEPGEEPEDDFDDPDDEDVLVVKSDHEFSPESDVDDSEWAPVRRARTLKKDDDDGDVSGGCVDCGKQDHPEWILLCDSCDAGWHASCLKPVLFLVPEGEWFCPPCNHKSLINALESQLGEYDEQVKNIELEDLNAKKESVDKDDSSDSEFEESGEKSEKSDNSELSASSDGSTTNSSDDEKIYRLRERRQLPISYRFKEYDQLISSAIKEEYKEDENSGAGNQGRGKDISTIIEAEKEEKKAMLQAAGGDEKEIAANLRKMAARARRKPRKLNSLEVLSDDADDNSDEDFKEAGWSSSSSEAITSEPDGSSSSSHSSDSMPLRRPQRKTQITRNTRRIIDSPERKKKSRRILDDTTEGSDEEKEPSPNKKRSNSSRNPNKRGSKKKKKSRSKRDGEDVEGGGDGRSKVKIKYGGLSDSSRSSHDWSPAHRTRQRKYNYMEMPNTESEEEAHKPSGKHMDSSDEYKGESDSASDSDSSRERNKRNLKLDEDSQDDFQRKMNAAAVSDILKGSLVPIVKLSDISPIKSDSNFQKDGNMDISNSSDLAKGENANHMEKRESTCHSAKTLTPLQAEREKKRKEKQEKIMEKEKRKEERIKKKEEKLQLKEQKAKEREEKKQARIANKDQKNKKIRTDYSNLSVPIPIMNKVSRDVTPIGAQIPLGPMPPMPFDNRGLPPRNMNPAQMKLDHPNIPPMQDFVPLPNSSKLQEQMMYRSQLNNMSPHMRHSESPNIIEPGGYPEDRKGIPVDHRLQMYPGDIRKIPGIIGPRPSLIGQRIFNPEIDNPIRHMPPGYNLPPGHIPDDMHIRPILNPAANHSMPRNGVPITDMTINNPNLSRHLSPNPVGVSPGLEGGPMVGPRGSTPKRRGRGPGKKTLARQAAAAATGVNTGNLSDGSSPGPVPSHSPLPEGTLTVAGAPQPFRPIVDPPSIITRMPHMMPPPYRGSSMYGNNSPMYGPPRGVSPNIAMPGAYRPHPPHPLDPSPSGGGPISMASPGRLSPHGHPYPYQSPSYYPPASTPPQLGPHGSPYAPPAGRFPPPHISAPQSISPASTNTQDSMEMDDKSKVFQDQSDQGQFLPCKPDIKQEPESLSIKQSTSPTDELEDAPVSEDQPEALDEPPSAVGSAITTPPRVHPQLKHSENKAEKISRVRIAHTVAARYPQGPYAPQYGPYAPYPAPPAPDIPYIHPSMHVMHPNIQNPQALTPIHRPPLPNPHHIAPVQILQRPPLIPVDHLRPEISIVPPQNPPSIAPTAVQNEEEAGEFGGLVSYFSSQQEDDIDT